MSAVCIIFNKVKTLSDKVIDGFIIHGFLGGVNGIGGEKSKSFFDKKIRRIVRYGGI